MHRLIVILAGPSGGGKTTVAERLCQMGNFEMSRSHTSRPPRGDGKDSEYIYVSREDFLALAEDNCFVEHTEYSGKLYGTSKEELERIFSIGKVPLLVLDYNGIVSFKYAKLNARVVSVYLYNSLDVIEKRLNDRVMKESLTPERKAFIEERCLVNAKDYADMPNRVENTDFFIENGELDKCVNEVLSAIDLASVGRVQPISERKERAKMLSLIGEKRLK